MIIDIVRTVRSSTSITLNRSKMVICPPVRPAAYSTGGARSRLKSLIKEMPGPRPVLPVIGTSWIYSFVGPYSWNKKPDFTREGGARSRLKSLKEMPGPRPVLPVIGTSWIYSIVGPYSWNKNPDFTREDMLKKYGPIYKEHLNGTTLVSIHDPKHIATVMRLQGRIPIRVVNEANVYLRRRQPDLYSSVGLVDSVGEEWYSLRNKVTPAIFKEESALTFVSAVSEIGNDFVELLKAEMNDDGVIPDIRTHLFRFGLEVIWKCTFGNRFNCLSSPIPTESEYMISQTSDLFHSMARLSLSRPWWKIFPSQTFNKFRLAEQEIFKTVSKHSQKAISEHQKMICPHADKDSDFKNCSTIIDRFLHDETFDRRDVNTVVVDFIAAGIMTTAYALSLLFHRLGKEPDVQKRLQNQLDEVLSGNSTAMTVEILSKAPLLKATLKEGYRLASIIPTIMRPLDEPVTLDGYEIPPYTPILCQIRAASCSDRYFTRPLEFIPERWLREISSQSDKKYTNLIKEARSHSQLVIPFGQGARMCIGAKLARTEMWILLAKILHNFTLESEGNIQLQNILILAPNEPVKLKLRDRR